ncbi:hypothetical protein Aperf_G00000123811 [Anoplocephala perfoliata]
MNLLSLFVLLLIVTDISACKSGNNNVKAHIPKSGTANRPIAGKIPTPAKTMLPKGTTPEATTASYGVIDGDRKAQFNETIIDKSTMAKPTDRTASEMTASFLEAFPFETTNAEVAVSSNEKTSTGPMTKSTYAVNEDTTVLPHEATDVEKTAYSLNEIERDIAETEASTSYETPGREVIDLFNWTSNADMKAPSGEPNNPATTDASIGVTYTEIRVSSSKTTDALFDVAPNANSTAASSETTKREKRTPSYETTEIQSTAPLNVKADKETKAPANRFNDTQLTASFESADTDRNSRFYITDPENTNHFPYTSDNDMITTNVEPIAELRGLPDETTNADKITIINDETNENITYPSHNIIENEAITQSTNKSMEFSDSIAGVGMTVSSHEVTDNDKNSSFTEASDPEMETTFHKTTNTVKKAPIYEMAEAEVTTSVYENTDVKWSASSDETAMAPFSEGADIVTRAHFYEITNTDAVVPSDATANAQAIITETRVTSSESTEFETANLISEMTDLKLTVPSNEITNRKTMAQSTDVVAAWMVVSSIEVAEKEMITQSYETDGISNTLTNVPLSEETNASAMASSADVVNEITGVSLHETTDEERFVHSKDETETDLFNNITETSTTYETTDGELTSQFNETTKTYVKDPFHNDATHRENTVTFSETTIAELTSLEDTAALSNNDSTAPSYENEISAQSIDQSSAVSSFNGSRETTSHEITNKDKNFLSDDVTEAETTTTPTTFHVTTRLATSAPSQETIGVELAWTSFYETTDVTSTASPNETMTVAIDGNANTETGTKFHGSSHTDTTDKSSEATNEKSTYFGKPEIETRVSSSESAEFEMTDLFYETTDIRSTDPSNETTNANMKTPFSETNNQNTMAQSTERFDVGVTAPSKEVITLKMASHSDGNINSVSPLVSFTDGFDEITRVPSLEFSDMKSSAQSDIETDVETTALFKDITKRETTETSYAITGGKMSDPFKEVINAKTVALFNDATDSEITASSFEATNPDTAVYSINITEAEMTALSSETIETLTSSHEAVDMDTMVQSNGEVSAGISTLFNVATDAKSTASPSETIDREKITQSHKTTEFHYRVPFNTKPDTLTTVPIKEFSDAETKAPSNQPKKFNMICQCYEATDSESIITFTDLEKTAPSYRTINAKMTALSDETTNTVPSNETTDETSIAPSLKTIENESTAQSIDKNTAFSNGSVDTKMAVPPNEKINILTCLSSKNASDAENIGLETRPPSSETIEMKVTASLYETTDIESASLSNETTEADNKAQFTEKCKKNAMDQSTYAVAPDLTAWSYGDEVTETKLTAHLHENTNKESKVASNQKTITGQTAPSADSPIILSRGSR